MNGATIGSWHAQVAEARAAFANEMRGNRELLQSDRFHASPQADVGALPRCSAKPRKRGIEARLAELNAITLEEFSNGVWPTPLRDAVWRSLSQSEILRHMKLCGSISARRHLSRAGGDSIAGTTVCSTHGFSRPQPSKDRRNSRRSKIHSDAHRISRTWSPPKQRLLKRYAEVLRSSNSRRKLIASRIAAQARQSLERNLVVVRLGRPQAAAGVRSVRLRLRRRHPPPPPPMPSSASPPPPPPGRLPSNCMLSPITRSLLRFWPDCLSSQLSSCRRPSIRTGRPFFRYSPAISAVRPQSVTSTNVDLFALLAAFGAVDAIDGEAEVGNRAALWRIADLRVAREVPDQDDFVEAGHPACSS